MSILRVIATIMLTLEAVRLLGGRLPFNILAGLHELQLVGLITSAVFIASEVINLARESKAMLKRLNEHSRVLDILSFGSGKSTRTKEDSSSD